MTDINIPHLQVPFSLGAGGAEIVEQDSDTDVIQCVGAICRTQKGTREDSPEFGIDDVVFREHGVDRDKLLNAITYWEPRAEISIDIRRPDVLNILYQLVEITVGGSV